MASCSRLDIASHFCSSMYPRHRNFMNSSFTVASRWAAPSSHDFCLPAALSNGPARDRHAAQLCSRGKHRLHAPLHLLRANILLVGGHPPEMPEGILELAGAVAVKLIHDRLALLGAGVQCPLHEGIHVLHVEMEAHRRPPRASGALPPYSGNSSDSMIRESPRRIS